MDRQTDRQTTTQTDNHSDRQTEIPIEIQTSLQARRWIGKVEMRKTEEIKKERPDKTTFMEDIDQSAMRTC